MIISNPNLEIRLAVDQVDVLSAQRLRYQVFVQELGGDGELVDHDGGLECDRFDAVATHLVLVDKRRDPIELNHVVGVYRLLTKQGAKTAGQYYSETEYDLSVLRQSGRRLLELGRSCVHPDYRGGPALFALWNGLATYVRDNSVEILFGVASFQGTDAGRYAQHFSYLYQNHLSTESLMVTARPASHLEMNLLTPQEVDRLTVMRTMPPLVKAYLRIGGMVGDGAFVDHQFNTTDVCLVVDAEQSAARQMGVFRTNGATS